MAGAQRLRMQCDESQAHQTRIESIVVSRGWLRVVPAYRLI
jgi:hypothetical protein